MALTTAAVNQSLAARAWQRLGRRSAGRWLFTRLVAFKAPYFRTIPAHFESLAPGRAEVYLAKRRKVLNHIGTVHAIAMANACELAAGTMMEVSVPRGFRWIPRSMHIHYVARGTTDLRASAVLPAVAWDRDQDVPVAVTVRDNGGADVLRGEIVMYVSRRTEKQAGNGRN